MPEGVEVRVPITDCILKDWQGNEVKFEEGFEIVLSLMFTSNYLRFPFPYSTTVESELGLENPKLDNPK